MKRARERGLGRIMSLTVGALLAAAMLPTAAQASQVGSVRVDACAGESGCSLTNTIRVDQQFGIDLYFHVTNGLASGNRIYIEGPEGFTFANDIYDTFIGYGTGGYSGGSHGTFNGGRGFEMEIGSWGPTVSAGSEIEVSVGLFENKLTTPAKPGEMHFNVWTSSDSQARESFNAITTTVGEPATMTVLTPGIAGTVGEAFAEQPEVELRDSRGNAVPARTVSFEAPATEPSGSYTGGLTSATGETDASGIATPATPLEAGTESGEWTLSVSGPNGTAATIPVTNLAGPASHVEIEVEPTTVPADGSSTAEATIEVEDAFGNAVTGDEISIDTEGGPSASDPSPQGDGTFTSLLTASTVPGEYAITATDTTAEPNISASTTLTQSKLPATSVELRLEPSAVAADPLEEAVAVATVRDELGQPVSGEDIEFESPYTEGLQPPTDNGDGTYTWTIPVTTAPGEYEITAIDNDVVPSISTSATLTQTPRPATAVKLSLQPGSIVADGKSTALAVATVTDRLGTPVSGDQLKFSSSGGNPVGPTVDHGDGTYSAVVTASAVPGAATITASDVSAGVSGTATLMQTPLPPPPAGGSQPAGQNPVLAAAAPAVTISGGPKGTVHGRKVRFRFAASGAAGSFECRLDGGKWKRCSSPAVFSVNPGSHLFEVRALSSTGAAGPVAKRHFTRAAKRRAHRHRR